MASHKKIIENQKKLIRKISELRKNSQKQRDKRDEIIDDSLKSVEKNQKELNNASKNNQITDEHYAQATFLNSVSKAVADDISSSDSNKLSEINENLKAIRKQISDFTKAVIDKQDTKISYTDPKRVSDVKEEKKSKSKGDKDKKGLLGWLANLLGFAFLPFINILRSIFKVGKILFKGASGIVKGLLWLGKNIFYLAKLTKNVILGAAELIRHPVRWFKTYLWNPVKLMVRGLVGNILSKIPLLKETKFVKNFVKGTQAAKGANAAAKEAAKAEKINAVKDKLKKAKDYGLDKVKKASNTLKGAVGGVWEKLMGKFRKIPGFSWVESKVKPIFDKVCDVCSKAWKKAQPILGKLWNIAKGPAKGLFKLSAKVIGRLVGFLVSAISAPPFSWILSLALGLWFLWDFFSYLIDNGFSASTFFAATIYALIGWDILGKDKEAWESVEPLDEKEAKRVSNNMTEKDIQKISHKEMEAKYSGDIKATEERINTLKNKTVLYKDASGNVLSLNESQKIQALELQKQELQLKRDKEDLTYKQRLESDRWLDGEVELTPENSKKLVDYMYEKLKNDSFYDHSFWGDMDIKKNIEMAEKYAKSAEEAWKQGDLKFYADQMARAEIYAKMVELYKSGTTNETDAQKILRSEKRFVTFADRRNQTTKEINDLNSKLKGFTEHSVQSADYGRNFTVPSMNTSLNTTGPIVTSGNFGAAPTERAAKAAAWSYSHYAGKKMGGHCARGVRKALQKGGKYNYVGPGSAFEGGPHLISAGFSPLSPSEARNPKIGDVAVIDKGGIKGDGSKSTHGHMAILTQGGWISDGYQPRGAYTPNVYANNPPTTYYRDTGKAGGSILNVPESKTDLSPSIPVTNNSLNTKPLFTSNTQETKVIASTTPQVPKEIKSTLDLTEYWELPV